MARNVFRPSEIVRLNNTVYLESPVEEIEEIEEAPAIEEYTGPTADDLRREAEAFKDSWEAEKKRLIDSASAQSEKIIEEARQTSFDEVKIKSLIILKSF